MEQAGQLVHGRYQLVKQARRGDRHGIVSAMAAVCPYDWPGLADPSPPLQHLWLRDQQCGLDSGKRALTDPTRCPQILTWLLQYHTWVRRCTPESLGMLKILRDVVQRWEDAVQPGKLAGPCKSSAFRTWLTRTALQTT